MTSPAKRHQSRHADLFGERHLNEPQALGQTLAAHIIDKTSPALPDRFGYLIIVITLYGRIAIIYGTVMR